MSTLANWIAIHIGPEHHPFLFRCLAEDYEHAEEQTQNAYPDHEVLWIVQTDDPAIALESWREV